MKKVLIAVIQLHKTSAGTIRNIMEQVRYFQARDCEVHLISEVFNPEIIKGYDLKIHKTFPWIKKTGRKRRWWFDLQVKRLQKKHHFDLIIGHGDTTKQNVLCLHNSVHLASEHIHNKKLESKHEMYQTHTPLLGGFPNTFEFMISNSNLMRNDTAKRFKVPQDKIKTIYPSYEDHRFVQVNEVTRKRLRDKYGFNKVTIGLITSGNFKKRGVDIFLKALEELQKNTEISYEVMIVGKDKNDELQKYINDHGIKNINFMPVISKVEEYFQAIDIFILPARIEEFGRVLLEAMACGLPVITTSMVGSAELIPQNQASCIIEDLNPTNLFLAMRNLIESPELRKTYGNENAKEAILHSEAYLHEKFDSVYSTYINA